MTILQALVLGIVQGLGEFLPISSSAHLVLVPWLAGWPEHGLSFDVALHFGTLIALVVYFWRDWVTLLKHGVHGVKTPEGRMFWYLVAASVPGAAAGYLLVDQAETVFRTPLSIGFVLAFVGLVLLLADRYGVKRWRAQEVNFKQSMLIGLAQALAIVPGVSRSGATMTAGLFLGLTREGAARFSFLLAAPIVAGASLFKLPDFLSGEAAVDLPFLIGIIASAVTGFFVIRFLLAWVRRSNYLPFVLYRLLAGAAVVTIALLRGT